MLDRLNILKKFQYFWYSRDKITLLNRLYILFIIYPINNYSIETSELIFNTLKKISIPKNKSRLTLDLALAIGHKCVVLLNNKYENQILFGSDLLFQIFEWMKFENKQKNQKVFSLKDIILNAKRVKKVREDKIGKYKVNFLLKKNIILKQRKLRNR